MSKNLRTTKMTVTAQTLYHLRRMAVMSGWDERDIGRVVDKLVRTHLAQQHHGCGAENMKGGQDNA